MSRWILPLLALVIGISLGLYYGWVVSPVQYVDTAPDTLRADYRADYVLMVAETYQMEMDPDLAVRRLAVLGSQAPGEIASQSLDYAREIGYSADDLALMQKLTIAMQAWQGSTP